jgi:multidrug efflux system membrane fusion protein
MTSTGVMTSGRLRAAPLLLLALLGACGGQKSLSQPPVPVTVAKAALRDVPYDIAATGTVEPIQTSSVTPQVTGQIIRVAFKEGDHVAAGQLLFQIDPRPFAAQLDQANAVMARDRAQLASAEADEKRYSDLAGKDYVTPQQLEQARATASALRATLAADSAAAQNAAINLQYTSVRAPIGGRAGAILLREGNLAKAQGNPLVVINEMRPILVRFPVPATNLEAIRAHQNGDATAHVDPIGPGGLASDGRLSFVDNAVDSTTGTVLLKAIFDNPTEALWPGELVNVRLRLFIEKGAVTVPSEAVVSAQQGNYVFVIGPDQTASTRPVKVERVAGEATIVSGVKPGEVVVTDGQLKLREGAKVQINTTAPSAAPAAQGDSAPGGAAR